MSMKMLKQMQAQMIKIQEELARETVEGTAGGGVVTVTMTGQQKVQTVQIAPEAVDADDVETLQDLLVAAFNDALSKAQELAARRLSVLTGGLKIPGLL